MKTISPQKTLWLSGTLLLTIAIILISIYFLKNGYTEIFPYFYLLPIILLAYLCPRYAVYITIALSWIFLLLVYVYGPPDIHLYATSSALFYIFVSIGVIVTAFASQLMHERKYREIFENSQAGIFTFDAQSQVIREINLEMAEILGYKPEELKGQSFSVCWIDHEEENRFMKKLLAEEKITDMELALRKKDRSMIWVIITASLTDGGLVICSAVDVTTAKKVKDELIESELRYRTLFDGASDAIIIHDTDGRIYETNVIASGQLGYTKRELMQMKIQDLENGEPRYNPEFVQRLLSRGHMLYETRQKKKDGSEIPVEISCRTTEYFGMPAIISIVRDESERKKS